MRALLIILMLLTSCTGQRNPAGSGPGKNSCLVNSNPEAFQECCAWHGGPKDCGLGAFEFTPDKKLVCKDNTISST